MQENQEMKDIFGGMTADDKKNISVYQFKIATLAEEKQKLSANFQTLGIQKKELDNLLT